MGRHRSERVYKFLIKRLRLVFIFQINVPDVISAKANTTSNSGGTTQLRRFHKRDPYQSCGEKRYQKCGEALPFLMAADDDKTSATSEGR